MRESCRWVPRGSEAQVAFVAALLLERSVSVATLPVTQGAYAAAAALVGAWLLWPRGVGGAPAARALAGIVRALAFGGAAAAWRWGWERLSADLAPAWLADWGPWLAIAAALLLDLAAVRRVLRLAGIEVQKHLRSRLVRLGALATVGVTLLAGAKHVPLPNETGWSLALGMLGAGFATAQVFVLVAGATAIAGEASQGTLKMVLPHAYRRSDWVLAKAASLALVAVLLALLATGAALAWVAAGDGLGDVLLKAEGFGGEALVTVHASAALMRDHATDVVAAQTLALVVTGLLGLAVSCLLTNVVGALCASFLLFAALRLGDLVLALDPDTLRRLFTWAPERLRELATKLGQGLSEGWDERLPAVGLLLSAATGGLCVLLGSRVFARRDLHV